MGRKCSSTGCVHGLGVKRNTAKCSYPTGAEDEREMEVYQGLLTGKLNH